MTLKKTAPPVGELFSRSYLDRGAPTQDSEFFRSRLVGYLEVHHFGDYVDLARFMKQESGLVVETTWLQKQNSVFYNFNKFFQESRIEFVLDVITLIWRSLRNKYPEFKSGAKLLDYKVAGSAKADAWRAFVSRAIFEENLSYAVDEACGIHYLVDEEFERNRVSVLRAADAERYAAVRAAFESAHAYLDAQPPDTKASVRSIFEALEILARLMDPQSKNLNKWQVLNKLKPFVLASAGDDIERQALSKMMDGIAEWVDSLHLYRHGQGKPDPVAPSPRRSRWLFMRSRVAPRYCGCC